MLYEKVTIRLILSICITLISAILRHKQYYENNVTPTVDGNDGITCSGRFRNTILIAVMRAVT